MKVFAAKVDTPVGLLLVVVDEDGALLRCSRFGGGSDDIPQRGAEVVMDEVACALAIEELCGYFKGNLTRFTVPVRPAGTEFQRSVWKALEAISYGRTITYRELAERVGRPGAARAVGGANGANPIAIIIPCHRVIGSNGSLTGYGGGIDMKRRLLELERRVFSGVPKPLQ
ncbi:MAG TPA: methylated-DNA--[protein]-cysteine S-methyltransferase [Thermoanaerobaculia bacterium]|nr:methylated-DNA--[protein]-cysteine S-methyltransferase [Thermoanaerobaculia bacterium]